MKKTIIKQLFLIAIFLNVIIACAQNPFPRGIETVFIDPIPKTNVELNAMTNIPDGRKAYSSTDSEWKVWDGDSWEAFGSGSSTNIFNSDGQTPDSSTRFFDLGANAQFYIRSSDLSNYIYFNGSNIELRNSNGNLRFRTGTGGTVSGNSIGDVWTATDAVGGGEWQAPSGWNHTATQNLNLNGFSITELPLITSTGNFQVSSGGASLISSTLGASIGLDVGNAYTNMAFNIFHNNDANAKLFSVSEDGTIDFPEYGDGSKTGTPAYNLTIDANGNIIEDAISSEIKYNVVDYGAIVNDGLDDTAAIQSAIQACFDAGGGTVYIPNGVYNINGALDTNSNSQIYFPLSSFSNTSALKTITLEGETPPNMYSNPFNAGVGSIENSQNGVIFESNLLSAGNVIGSRSEVIAWGDFNFLQAHIKNISVRVRSMTGATHVQPLATGINMGNVYNFTGEFFDVSCTSPLSLQLEPATTAIGVVMPKNNNWTLCNLNNFNVRGMYIGVDLWEHSNLDAFLVDTCVIGLNFNNVNHSIHVNKGVVARSRYNLQFQNTSYFKIDHISFEDDYSGVITTPGWNTTLYDVNDVDQTSKGVINYHIVRSNFGVDYSVVKRNSVNNDLILQKIYEVPTGSTSTTPSIDNTDLLAYWKFEESSGDFIDSSPNGVDATRQNTPTVSSGKIDNALTLDESTEQHANAGSSGLSYANGALTISGWFKINTNGQAFQTLLNKGDSSEREYNIYYTKSTGRLTFVMYNGTTSAGSVDIAVNENIWFFLIAERIGTSQRISINNGTPITTTGSTVNAAAAKDLLIGQADSAGASLGGQIDELSFWQRELTTNDKAYLYNNGDGQDILSSSSSEPVASNPNQVLVDDESDFVGTDKEFIITTDFSLTQDLDLPSGARLVDGGGIMTTGANTIDGPLMSFHSAYNRTFIDLGANGVIDDNATFANHTINMSWFGFVFDGDEVAGTGTDNRNQYLQTLKIINKIGGSHVFVTDGTGTENVSYSVNSFTQSYTEPSNFYISGNVSLYLGQGVKITALPNANDDYDVMSIWNPDNARIWGPGEIVGEVRNHTFSGNDEGCHGVIIYGNGEKASVEVTIRNVSGDGAIQRGNPLYTSVGGLQESNFTKDFFIEDDGSTTADTNYAYSILFDITGTIQTYGHFRLAGQGFSGNFGLDVQKFYVAYYDASDVFIERTGLLQTYRDIEVKPEYKKMRIIIHTPSVWGDLDGSIVTLITPKRVKISSPLITMGVRQGISNLGAFGEISGIKFYKIGRRFDGTVGSPAYAVDLEDGYQGNTNVWIHNNIFDKCYNGFITLIAPTNAIIENNYFMHSDDPDYPGNGISSWKGEGTIFRFNTQYGTSVSLGRNSQSHNNMSYDVKWLIHKDNEVIRNETQNFNPKYVYSIVNVGSDYAYIKDTYNIFDKPNESTDYIFYIRNQSDVVWERNTFDFTKAPAFDNSSNRLTSVTNGAHTTASRGSATDMTFIDLEMSTHTSGLQWIVQPLKNWKMPSCGLDIRGGLTADFESENVEVAWLNLELNDFPSTNGGDASLYNTLTYKDLKIKPADDTYLSTVRYALFAEDKDVNLVFDGGYIDLQFGNVYDGQLLFDFQHYGTTTFKNFSFSTDRPSTTLNLDTLVDGEPITFIDCEFSDEITLNFGSNGHKRLFTKAHPDLEVYADNAAAVTGGIPVGYMYRTSTGDTKIVY